MSHAAVYRGTLLHKHYMAFRSLIDRDAEIWHRMFRCDLYVLDFADFARAPLEATNDIMSWLGFNTCSFDPRGVWWLGR